MSRTLRPVLALRNEQGELIPLVVCHGEMEVTKPHLGGLIRQKLVTCSLFTFVFEPIEGGWEGESLAFPDLEPLDAFCALQLKVQAINPDIAQAIWQHKKLLNTIGDEQTQIPTVECLPIVSFEAACDRDLLLYEIVPPT